MKAFNLDSYLKNPSRKVVTRGGRNVRIICTNRRSNTNFPIIALVELEDEEKITLYTKNGICFCDYIDNSDLCFATEKREGWINTYKDSNDVIFAGSNIYKSKEDAEAEGNAWGCYVATAKIEWEE